MIEQIIKIGLAVLGIGIPCFIAACFSEIAVRQDKRVIKIKKGDKEK